MHCNICDKDMSDKETQWSSDLGTYEPCTVCLDIAMEAAYSNGWTTEDDEFVLLEPYDDETYYEPFYSNEEKDYD